MFKVNLNEQNFLAKNSNIFKVSVGKTYEITTNIIGKSGDDFSAYFGVVFLDDNEVEKSRIIKWLNDFSGHKKQIKIIFKALTERILLIYRINNETPNSSKYSIELKSFEELVLKKSKLEESFDNLTDYVLPRKNELTPSEEKTLEKNLVWILGSPRSGTTWLSLQLLSYNTHVIDHPHITEHLGTPHVGILDLTYSRWVDQCRNVNGYFFNDAFKETWKYYLRKLILNRIYAQVGNFTKKIILKEPSVTSGADIISECLPNSQMIFLFRDGRDIIDSILDARQKDGFMNMIHNTPPITKQNRFNFIENRSKLWVYLIDNLLKTYENHSKKSRMLIKYEVLLKNTKEILKTIYELMEIEIDSKILNDLVEKFSFKNIPKDKKGTKKFARSASPGSWQEHFDENEKAMMEKIMRSTLDKLGYN